MPIWLKRLLPRSDALNEVPEDSMHEWAEFNLPTRDNLAALFRAEEDAQAGSRRPPDYN
jgi:hypothetical protein